MEGKERKKIATDSTSRAEALEIARELLAVYRPELTDEERMELAIRTTGNTVYGLNKHAAQNALSASIPVIANFIEIDLLGMDME